MKHDENKRKSPGLWETIQLLRKWELLRACYKWGTGLGAAWKLLKAAVAAGVSRQASSFLTLHLMLPDATAGDNWFHDKSVSSKLLDSPLRFSVISLLVLGMLDLDFPHSLQSNRLTPALLFLFVVGKEVSSQNPEKIHRVKFYSIKLLPWYLKPSVPQPSAHVSNIPNIHLFIK